MGGWQAVGAVGALGGACEADRLPALPRAPPPPPRAGAEVVVCVSVNDAFVMDAWGQAHGVGDKVTMLADARVSRTRGWLPGRACWAAGDGRGGGGALGS